MKKVQILVVEDERIVALDLHDTLQRLGYPGVILASSGQEAIEKALRLRPDLVLMDIVLDGPLDGVETAARIRERLNVPIIFVTAHGDDAMTSRALRTLPERFIRFVIKPFDTDTLRNAIEGALGDGGASERIRRPDAR